MVADARRAVAGATLLAALLLCALPAAAHRGHAVWTDIAWNGEYFEVTHRMHLADAISINRFAGGSEPIEDLRSLARVAVYVEERFRIGDGDSAVFALGMIVGAGLAHNFALAGTPDAVVEGVQKVGGISPYGMAAVVLGLVVCVVIGLTMREKMEV